MFRTIAALAALSIFSSTTHAQELGIASPSANDYFFLKAPREMAEASMDLRPGNTWATPADIEWERYDPSDAGLKDALSINWYAQASCASGMEQVRISGPGGSQVQNISGDRNTIRGRTKYQSFSIPAAEAVCIRWANQVTAACGENPQTEPACENERTFTYTEAQPLPRSPAVQTSGSCQSGNLPTSTYRGDLKLTCRISSNN